mgnify:CR=1 FL=1
MAKKILALVLVLVTFVTYSYAQPTREASPATVNHAVTNYTNLGLSGMDVDGNPGYLILTGAAQVAEQNRPNYYIWVDDTGDLCMASYVRIQGYASFPNGNWTGPTNGKQSACTKVGGQS